MVSEEIRLYASHRQFYVRDSEPLGTSDDPSFWSEEAIRNQLAISDGMLAIGTGSYDFVKVRVEEYTSEPPVDLSLWDHVTEAGLEMRTKYLFVMGCLSSSGLFFRVRPGHYRVRCCHANLAESEAAGWEGEPGDWYLVQFWLSAPAAPRVLKGWFVPAQGR